MRISSLQHNCAYVAGVQLVCLVQAASARTAGSLHVNASNTLGGVTSHCVIHAGTSLRYVPGLITGGAGLRHDCGRSRAMGYFLEPLVCLSLFGKKVNILTAPLMRM